MQTKIICSLLNAHMGNTKYWGDCEAAGLAYPTHGGINPVPGENCVDLICGSPA